MKDADYRFSKLKHQLKSKKAEKFEYVIWKLNEQQVEYIQTLGYRVEPYLYVVITKRLPGSKKQYKGIIRGVISSNEKGIWKIYRKLKHQERKELEKCNIHFYPFKYKIFL